MFHCLKFFLNFEAAISVLKSIGRSRFCIATSYLPLSDIALFLHFDGDCQDSEDTDLFSDINSIQMLNFRAENFVYLGTWKECKKLMKVPELVGKP